MKALLLFCILVGMAAALSAQPAPPDTLWTRDYHDLNRASATAVIPSFDGGMVLAGWQEFPGDTHDLVIPEDLIVMQTDAVGNPEWTFRAVGSMDTVWQGVTVSRTADSAYVALAQRRYGDTLSDFTLVKLSRAGEQIWRRSYLYFQNAWVWTLSLLNNGSYVVGANAQIYNPNDPFCTNNLFVANIDTNGDTLWTRIWRGNQCERLTHYIVATSDGGCLVLGADCPEGHDPCNPLMIKLDAQGNTQWERMDPQTSEYGRACVLEVSDGYIIGRNFYRITQLEKVNLQGETQWVQSYEVETERIESPNTVIAAADGGYLIALDEQLYTVHRTAPGLAKTDAQGNLQWRMIADLISGNNSPGFCQTPDGKLVFAGCGYVPGTYDPGHVWMMEYAWPEAAAAAGATLPERTELCPNFPNPFNPVTEIAFDLPRTTAVQVKVFDLLGQDVATLVNGTLPAGHHTVPFDGSALPSGMYVCQMQTPAGTQAVKMMLLK